MDPEYLPTPKHAIGDFVRCWYDLYDYYYGWSGFYDDPCTASMHGIIVDIDYATWGDCEMTDIIYVVYCIDGVYRFFIENEIYKLS